MGTKRLLEPSSSIAAWRLVPCRWRTTRGMRRRASSSRSGPWTARCVRSLCMWQLCCTQAAAGLMWWSQRTGLLDLHPLDATQASYCLPSNSWPGLLEAPCGCLVPLAWDVACGPTGHPALPPPGCISAAVRHQPAAGTRHLRDTGRVPDAARACGCIQGGPLCCRSSDAAAEVASGGGAAAFAWSSRLPCLPARGAMVVRTWPQWLRQALVLPCASAPHPVAMPAGAGCASQAGGQCGGLRQHD